MDGRQTAGMARIPSLEQVESFAAPDFSQNDAVRPVPESRPQQVPDRYCRPSGLPTPRLKPDQVGLGALNLGGILNQNDAIGIGNECGERREQCGLSAGRCSTDQDVLPALDCVVQIIENRGRNCTSSDEFGRAEKSGLKFPDR